MFQMRKGVFETNSSSCHSLVICKEDEWEGWRDYLQDYKAVITPGFYGRGEPYIVHSVKDKLRYIWTGILGLYVSVPWHNDIPIIYFNEFFEFQKMLQKIMPNVVFHFDEKTLRGYDWGIDHVSELEEFFNECKENPQYLEWLIFEDNSYIVVEGDEYSCILQPFIPNYWNANGSIREINPQTFLYIKGN